MLDRRRFLQLLAVTTTATVPVAVRRTTGGPVTVDKIGDQVQTVPRGQLPDFAGPGTPEIRSLYAYALEHGDDLRYIPCFCGCVNFGHTSNRDCYIKASNRDGTLTFTSHAAT